MAGLPRGVRGLRPRARGRPDSRRRGPFEGGHPDHPHGRKIEATVHNAEAIVALDQDTAGGIRAWLGSRGGFEETIDAMRKEFKFIGDMGAYYVLHVIGEPVPDHQEAMHLLAGRKR